MNPQRPSQSFDDVVPAPVISRVPTTDGRTFPVRRIFCVGQNYADHVREMGGDPASGTPVFFTKPADAVICPTAEAPHVPFVPSTDDLHYEGELVVALGRGGRDLDPDAADRAIWGTGLGCDLTRRDLQRAAKTAGAPWDMAKGFDHSAVLGPLSPGRPNADAVLSLSVNGDRRQRAALGAMIWTPSAILAALSRLVELKPGDLVFTGTPEGVGKLVPGDHIRIDCDGLAPLSFTMGPVPAPSA